MDFLGCNFRKNWQIVENFQKLLTYTVLVPIFKIVVLISYEPMILKVGQVYFVKEILANRREFSEIIKVHSNSSYF